MLAWITFDVRHAARGAGTAFLCLALTACGPQGEPVSGETLRVVATTGMIADAAREVGGDAVSVVALMGPGIDPHLFKASAGDVRRLADAELILFHGLHLEAAMAEVLEEMAGRIPSVAVGQAVPEDRRLHPPEFSGAPDPHVWFDVGLWSLVVEAVERALVEVRPAEAAALAARSRAYRERLRALDGWVREQVAILPPDRRVLITAHDAFAYFGRAYGFEVRGLQGISTVSEAGAADVRRLAEQIVDREIPAVFIETSVSPRTIEAVREAVRARGFDVRLGGALFSDAMGDPGTPEGRYEGMVRHNVSTIVDALREGT